MKLYIDYETKYADWFQTADDGSILRLPTVTVAKRMGKMRVLFHTGRRQAKQ